MAPLRIPLANAADRAVASLASVTKSPALGKLDGMTLLGERAMHAGFRIPGRISAGGGCQFHDALGGAVALNLARLDDRELLPALFETECDSDDDASIEQWMSDRHADALVERGRMLGLAIASERETIASPTPYVELVSTAPVQRGDRTPPRVLDLSALWAGPLAAHLLWLGGAQVVKVESRRRPDAMRDGDEGFYRLLNQGKASVVLDLTNAADRDALLRLIAGSDIVIEAARPRALLQMGIDADALVRAKPGLVWMTITGHGASGETANWVGFGDDCGVAGGLAGALRAASGKAGFVGDAIADPLAGLWTASHAWQAWSSGHAGRFGVAMSHVAAACLREEQSANPDKLEAELRAWGATSGEPFPEVQRRSIGALRPLGADTWACLARVA